MNRLEISADGTRTELPKPWSDSSVAYWLDDQRGSLLIAPSREEHIFRVDIPEALVEPLADIERFEDSGLRRMRLISHENDVIAVYELGAIYFENGVRVRWQVRFREVDWFVDGLDDGVLRFGSEHGGTVAYRLVDGKMVNSEKQP
jgi:hypothetical protein